MNNERLFLDVHVLQTVPPVINRDDTGSLKVYYGGVKRARVSSQSWKRAMRKMFEEKLEETKSGRRTQSGSKRVGGLGIRRGYNFGGESGTRGGRRKN